ncbi:hypothetical protein [Brachybacterium sacelli]|uniref:hypothetical protein n=1 Tax=Brachybacterium sacelli TaxID=173364 RepID=UPI00361F3594
MNQDLLASDPVAERTEHETAERADQEAHREAEQAQQPIEAVAAVSKNRLASVRAM